MSMHATIVAGQDLYGTILPDLTVTIRGLPHESRTTRLLIDNGRPSGLAVYLLNGKEVKNDSYGEGMSGVDLKELVKALRLDLEDEHYVPFEAAANIIDTYLKTWKKAGAEGRERLTAVVYCS